jgi:hypothetical protein
MVNNGAMRRTQIYLGPEVLELLERPAALTGASRSALIRRAIHRTFGDHTASEHLAARSASAGSWGSGGPNGRGCVDAMRGDLNERLSSHGLP